MARFITKTNLANKALSLLGQSSVINDIDSSTSPQATTIRLHLEASFQTALLTYDWTFATAFSDKLKVVDDCPKSGFKYAYSWPMDALRIRDVNLERNYLHNMDRYNEDIVPFRNVWVDGLPQIHTDLSEAVCEYTDDISIEGAFPLSFSRMASATLALDIAPSIITNNFAKVQARLMSNINLWKNQAIAEDKLNESPRIRPISPFIKARGLERVPRPDVEDYRGSF